MDRSNHQNAIVNLITDRFNNMDKRLDLLDKNIKEVKRVLHETNGYHKVSKFYQRFVVFPLMIGVFMLILTQLFLSY
ncbi:MAG: hypothetical protein OXE77_02515 [Flavobacteriaceae bacterium]|nr:hypothetical protein [Flavobacteriaceae bacterium]MCY4268038.1 hypothetical protein [Flavobacteriaceae bacterium]